MSQAPEEQPAQERAAQDAAEREEERGQDAETPPAPPPPPLGDDFAEEHTGATFADQDRGGPEGAPEPESPEGYAGMDPG